MSNEYLWETPVQAMLRNPKELGKMNSIMKTQIDALTQEIGKSWKQCCRVLANEIGIDYATLKNFVEGKVQKPSEKTLQSMQTYLDEFDASVIRGESTADNVKDRKISELEAKIRQLQEEIDYKDKSREELRLSYVKVREQLDSVQAQDPEFHEQYQVVHPENSYWMTHSDMYIEIYTTGTDWEDSAKRNRVCTIPIPDTTMLLHQGQVPQIRVEKEDGSFDFIPDPDYVKISENDKGEVWEAPETVTSRGHTRPAHSVVVESREQFDVRRDQVRAENFALVADAAKAIEKMYRKCGGIPDTEVYVGLRVDVTSNVF